MKVLIVGHNHNQSHICAIEKALVGLDCEVQVLVDTKQQEMLTSVDALNQLGLQAVPTKIFEKPKSKYHK